MMHLKTLNSFSKSEHRTLLTKMLNAAIEETNAITESNIILEYYENHFKLEVPFSFLHFCFPNYLTMQEIKERMESCYEKHKPKA